MSKESWMAIALILAIALGASELARHYAVQDRDSLKLQLAAEIATTATGACGNQFMIAGLGKNKDQVAVAGQIVLARNAGDFFQKEETVKREDAPLEQKMIAVYLHEDGTGEKLIFRRPQR
jgi:hypothetical protein